MAVICPSILATDEEQYRRQMEKVAGFAHRIQIDLTDGKFAASKTVKPEGAWWPVGIKADFHLMYEDPRLAVKVISEHRPNMIIVHAEAKGDFETFSNYCAHHGIKVGIALLPKTNPARIEPALPKIDHVLIFSGNLGHYGGYANQNLLHKVSYLKSKKPQLEIGWDGGVNEQNISHLASGGIDVFVVGAVIHEADNPARVFHRLQRIADETGTT